MVSKSTIVIFIVVFTILGLLLGFAESNYRQRLGDFGAAALADNDSNSVVTWILASTWFDTVPLEVNPKDGFSSEG